MKINEVLDSWWGDDRRFRWHERGEHTLKPVYYWSYGMLCDPSNMQFERAHMIGRAYLEGYKLEMLTHANVVRGDGGMWGTLWRVNFNIIKQLDMVEGYPEYYGRIVESVRTDDDKTVDAQIYAMTGRSRARSLDSRPALGYALSIKRGYQHAGIPVEQLSRALQECRERLVDRGVLTPNESLFGPPRHKDDR